MREARVCRPMDPARQTAVEGMNARKGHGGNLPIDVQQTAQMLPFCNTAIGRRCPESVAIPTVEADQVMRSGEAFDRPMADRQAGRSGPIRPTAS
jgi:hypothetical protein